MDPTKTDVTIVLHYSDTNMVQRHFALNTRSKLRLQQNLGVFLSSVIRDSSVTCVTLIGAEPRDFPEL